MADYLKKSDGFYFLKSDGSRFLLSPQTTTNDEGEILADPIDLITANPDPANPQTFATEADLYVQQFKATIPQLNNALIALRLVAVSDTSTTSNTIDLLSDKTFTVSANKSFLPGQYLVCADTVAPTANSMIVQVKSYSGTTLIVTPLSLRGSGTKAQWTFSLSAPVPTLAAASSVLKVTTGLGFGTTNTHIRRFTTIVANTGASDWTYADSATLGASVTILRSGLYYVSYADSDGTGGTYGVSVNSTQLTTAFASINEAHKWFYASGSIGVESASKTGYLSAGDVLRCHTDGGAINSDSLTRLIIERIL